MPSKCCVVGCSKRFDRDKGIRFFRFPAANEKNKLREISEERRRAWITAIKRKDLKIESLKYTRICSNHFITGQPAELKDKLHPDWTPNINMGYKTKEKNSIVQRHDRYKKREIGSNKIAVSEDKDLVEVELNETQSEINLLKTITEQKNEEIKRLQDEKNCLVADLKMIADSYEKKLIEKDITIENLKKQLENKDIGHEGFKNDDKKVKYFTGLPNYIVLNHLFDFVEDSLSSSVKKNINIFDGLIITLMKLRLDLPFKYLAFKYGVTAPTISWIFHHNLTVLHAKIGGCVHWPDKNALKLNIPDYFVKVLGNRFTAIIDCFEIFIEAPGKILARSNVFSSYKHHSTIKFLIGISPAGAITFISKGYGGRCSDKTIVQSSGFLDNVLPGDIILSDRGMLVNQVVVEKGAKLLMPAFRNGRNQMDVKNIEQTRNLAKIRIHVERVIGVLRQKYLILTNRQPITAASKCNGNKMYYDYIVKTCCALVNLSPSVINTEK